MPADKGADENARISLVKTCQFFRGDAYLSGVVGARLVARDSLATVHRERRRMPEKVISAEIKALPNRTTQAAMALQRLGFRILYLGSTISVQASQSLWQSIFNVAFETRKKAVVPEAEGGEVFYQKALTNNLRVPESLQDLIAEVMFVEPPEFH